MPSMCKNAVSFHSRHIPDSVLDFDTPMGREVRHNGLCDALEPSSLNALREMNVGVIETRAVWWELEPQPGYLDFSRLDRDIERILRADMRVGVFPWWQHPPAWYDPEHREHARYRCLAHGEDSSILSLWDGKTLDVYNRMYGLLAERYGRDLSFLYIGVSGDYGEVCYPSGVKHYQFSPSHGHEGFWCGDDHARLSFRQTMEARYSDITALNHAWQSTYRDWSQVEIATSPLSLESIEQRRAFADWYTGSLIRFLDQVCDIARRHFPKTEAYIPIGFPYEPLRVGQIKSQAVKTAAKHNIGVRWTGMAFLKSFARSNIFARRIASAAQLYKTQFATEAALILDASDAADGIYESLANGASIIHDDPSNISRARDTHERLRPLLSANQPVSDSVLLYPLDDEMLDLSEFHFERFINRAARLREAVDYHVCDRHMILDGILKGRKNLFLASTCTVTNDVLPALIMFLDSGGMIWCEDDAGIRLFQDNECVPLCEQLTGVRERKLLKTQIGSISDFHARLALDPVSEKVLPQTYFTQHSKGSSSYDKVSQVIDINRSGVLEGSV